MTVLQQRAAVGAERAKKMTRPGGQPGGSGAAQGWMRRPCRTQDPRSVSRSSVIAGADAADVIAVSVELANPAAAAIAAIVITVVARSDRAADHGGSDETGADAPAKAETMG